MREPSHPSQMAVPATFWTRADVAAALSGQDAGALLRLLRQYTGASQHKIGAAIDMAQPHVSAIMSGKRQVTALRSWQRIADGLSMPNEPRRALGLAHSEAIYLRGQTRGNASMPKSGDLWSAPRTLQDIAEMTLKDLMKRRDALAVGGALFVGSTLTETLQHWLRPGSPLVGPHRGTLGESELQRIEAATAELRHWDDRWRMGIRRKAVVGQLSEVGELIETPQPPTVQSRLFVVMAELSKIIAAMSYDAGDHPTAQQYYTASLRAVHQAGREHRLYGVGVLADMSRQMLDVNRPQDALEISRLALDGARACPAPAPVLAILRTREGWSYARMGLTEAYHRTVAQAEDLLGEGTEDDLPTWARNFDHAELSGVVGARYRDLASQLDDRVAKREHARLSAVYIKQALRLRDPSKNRNRAFDLVGLGRTYLLLDEPEEAARNIREAASIERTLGSGRVRRRLNDWHKESAAYHRNPAVAEVRGELSNTLLAEQSNLKELT